MHRQDARRIDVEDEFGEDIVAFGSLQLNRSRRILFSGHRPIAMRGKAMEILLALTESPGVILSNRELLRRIWPKAVVEAGTVRAHVALLRKVLREAEPGSQYVHNVTGRGYRFVALMSPRRGTSEAPSVRLSNLSVVRLPVRQTTRTNNLPRPMTSVIGRHETRTLVERIATGRFVTVTGAGGCGKSTVAIAAAESLDRTVADCICFVPLSSLKCAEELRGAIAAALGLQTNSPDCLREILACLSKRSTLLILDSCEHLIDGATGLIESILSNCPQMKVLATSREPLRAGGEIVHEIGSLSLPAAFERLSHESIRESAAVQLFIERTRDHIAADPGEPDLALVANICRRLAGNPLAIEIAASQARWLGLRTLSISLEDSMLLSIAGRRTADSRHRSMRASFDWSHEMLTHAEQAVFRRLSLFSGRFSPHHAAAVIADEQLTPDRVMEYLISLARKSLIVADRAGNEVSYELNDLQRAYAREKLHSIQEPPFIYRRHSHMWRGASVEQIHAHARLWRSGAASEQGVSVS